MYNVNGIFVTSDVFSRQFLIFSTSFMKVWVSSNRSSRYTKVRPTDFRKKTFFYYLYGVIFRRRILKNQQSAKILNFPRQKANFCKQI